MRSVNQPLEQNEVILDRLAAYRVDDRDGARPPIGAVMQRLGPSLAWPRWPLVPESVLRARSTKPGAQVARTLVGAGA